jgi:hypothetical protein
MNKITRIESIQAGSVVTGDFSLDRPEGLDTAQLFRRLGSGCFDTLSRYTARMPLLLKDLEFQTPAEDFFADNSSSDEDESLKQYAITAHGIKSASYAIMAYRAGQAAKILEDAAWEGNVVFIRYNTPDFLLYMEHFIDGLEQFITRTRGYMPGP